MPLWTDALMADCGHLSDQDFGLYIKLLVALWRAPDQRLPNDDQWLAHRFARSVEAVRKELRPLISEFCRCDGNWIRQNRVDREFDYVRKRSYANSVRAKARWNKEKKDAGAMHPHPHHESLSSSSSRTVAARARPPDTLNDTARQMVRLSLEARTKGNGGK